jgi:hypothetical protein
VIKPSVHPWALHTLHPCRFETLFAQLWLGTDPLIKALFQINQAPSPFCLLCQVPESAHHYLIACAEYAEARCQLHQQINSQGILDLSLKISPAAIGYLLLKIGGDIASSLTWPQTCRAVENFICTIMRFDP